MLDLFWNPIASLSADAFSQLGSLRVLRFTPVMAALDPNVFGALANLEDLYMPALRSFTDIWPSARDGKATYSMNLVSQIGTFDMMVPSGNPFNL